MQKSHQISGGGEIAETKIDSIDDAAPASSGRDQRRPEVLLEETFYINSRKKATYRVQLCEETIRLVKESGKMAKMDMIRLENVIGCRCIRGRQLHKKHRSCALNCRSADVLEEQPDPQAGAVDDTSVFLYIYAYQPKKVRRSVVRERKVIALRFRSFDVYEENNREAQRWRATLKALIANEQIRLNPKMTRRLLVFLNPKSGQRRARETFHQQVATIFHESEIGYDLYVTKRQNFARDFVRTCEIKTWHAIVVLGGDGMCFEVINGMLERNDWEEALRTTAIGIIPCGSGNGLAKTICHLFGDPLEAKPIQALSLAVARGNTVPMDLVRIETRSAQFFSQLSCGWGFISDIDIESERLRIIGGQRFTIWSLHRLLNLKRYRGTIWYLPTEKPVSLSPRLDAARRRASFPARAEYFESLDDLSSVPDEEPDSFRSRFSTWQSAKSNKSAFFSLDNDSVYRSSTELNLALTGGAGAAATTSGKIQMFGPAPTLPALTASLNGYDRWKSITDDFVLVHAAYQTHLGEDCFFLPGAKLDDGIIWLFLIRGDVTRSQLLSFLLGFSSGEHIALVEENSCIQLIPCTAFRIEPLVEDGIFTVDGERVEFGPIQGEICPQLANVIVP